MADIAEVEKALLALPAADRERLALKAWESLVDNDAAAADPGIDAEGVELASNRDADLECGQASAISEREFRRHTGGAE